MTKNYILPDRVYEGMSDEDDDFDMRAKLVRARDSTWQLKFLIRHARSGRFGSNSDEALVEFFTKCPYPKEVIFSTYRIGLMSYHHVRKLLAGTDEGLQEVSE